MISDFPIVTTIQSLGGPAKVAAALGIHEQTAYGWMYRSVLPKWRLEPLTRLAEQAGLDVKAMRRREAKARREIEARLESKRQRRAKKRRAV